MAFNLKALIFKDEADKVANEQVPDDNVVPVSKPTTSFSTQNTFSTPQPPSVSVAVPVANNNTAKKEILDKVVDLYQKGFDALNLPEPDFWEFYQAINENPSPTPDTYEATFNAFKMLRLTKDKLLEYGGYYVTEISKQHKLFDDQGNQKIQTLLGKKDSEESQLKSEEETLQKQIADLQKKLSSVQSQLKSIDAKYAGQHDELLETLSANNIAKDTFLSQINTVINGIKEYVK